MSDFDDVLERLLTDVAFKAALAADPGTALAGYQLAADERELLYIQLSTGTGGDRRVEERTTKAGLFGLLSPLAEAAGHVVQVSGLPPADPDNVDGLVRDDLTGFVVPDNKAGPGPLGAGLTELPGRSGLSAAPPPPVDYHPNVDIDGDGRWDRYTVNGGTGGGLDLSADMDHDGQVDFVGHDDNRDGIIDGADYDKDHDGVLETHMSDVDGDGWMDRRWHG